MGGLGSDCNAFGFYPFTCLFHSDRLMYSRCFVCSRVDGLDAPIFDSPTFDCLGLDLYSKIKRVVLNLFIHELKTDGIETMSDSHRNACREKIKVNLGT